MNFHFTHPLWLLALLPALAWIVWLAVKSDVQTARWRRWASGALRVLVLLLVLLAIAGLQWLRPIEGMNVFFLMDRSDSVPSAQQDKALEEARKLAEKKEQVDNAGVIVFGTEAAIEYKPNVAMSKEKIQAVVGTERTDLGAAIRLGTAGFPETGQKRLVLMSDGNENIGDAMTALVAAKSLGVTLDVVPVGAARVNDVSVQKLGLPSNLKKGTAFEAKIFVQADHATPATIRLYRNDQYLGEQAVQLEEGKNLLTFPQKLTEPGFYNYDVRVEASGDVLPQNNRASAFTFVRGEPRLLVVSSEPDQDQTLVQALQSLKMAVRVIPPANFPASVAELQDYDSIFLCNVNAGDLGRNNQNLLESAVRDFGVGLVCVGGDQSFAAGGYRNTPLETMLPVSMELDSKKVLPSGAVVLVMHGMEFANGNQVARDCAQGVLAALAPQDQMGVILWDGTEHWVFPLAKVGDKKAMSSQIAGMNQGDMVSFQGVLEKSHEALKKCTSNLKHIIVFSDGDPGPPTDALMQAIVGDKITVSTVLISGHFPPDSMIRMADLGKGRFYNVTKPEQLPQIFLKETAVILKSAIYEEPFKPQVRAASELIRGIGANEYPQLLGYVASSPKPRAETPLWTHQGDPLLAHWQYGLGRTVAFTSDAKPRWAKSWLAWEKYRQFWVQVAQWSLRRAENADFSTDVSLEKGDGVINVEALDTQGNYRNFLNLQAIVVSPKGERVVVPVRQSGPGHYEAKFPTKEPGVYAVNVVEMDGGKVVAQQTSGASINYSPEFVDPEPNYNLLRRLADLGGGRLLDIRNPADNSFLHDRLKTFQPMDLWEWLLRVAVILFVLDVGFRRIQIEREDWLKFVAAVKGVVVFWRPKPKVTKSDESLSALLQRRDAVRAGTIKPVEERPELFQPTQPITLPLPGSEPKPEPVKPAAEAAPTEGEKKPESSMTSLLEAKRRAQKKK
jgi:Ca-activated chloride channel family protein